MSDNKEYVFAEGDAFVKLVGEEDFHRKIALVKGERFLEYRRQWEQAGRFELETPGPLQVDFELSTFCNFRCRMCPFGMPQDARPAAFNNVSGWFPYELFCKIIDEGVAVGLSAIDLSYYNEPLLCKDLLKFIEYADSRGVVDVMLSSNAQLLTPEMSEKLLGTGLTRFMVSLDAETEETFNKIRVGGDFKVVVRNLEHFLRLKREKQCALPITRVSFVRTKINEHEIDAFLQHWKPLVDYVSVQGLVAFNESKRDLIPSGQTDFFNGHCHQPWHRITIRANGDALPCCTPWGQQLVLGNLKTQSLVDIWNGPQMRRLRRLHREGRYQEEPICRLCAESSVLG